jgi:uncharacterized membrane protein
MTGSLFMLSAAMIAFLAIHIIPSSYLRVAIVSKIGTGAYLGLFSLLSIAAFAWLIYAYIQTPIGSPNWNAGNAGLYLGTILMPIAFILFVSAYTSPNPTTLGGDKLVDKEFAYGGINAITRHPLMWSIILWSIVHVINNSDSTSLIFFVGFGVLALAGTFLIDRKKAQQLQDGWDRYAARTSNIPFLALLQGRATFSFKPLWWRILLGLFIFAAVFHFHASLFGVSPVPMSN